MSGLEFDAKAYSPVDRSAAEQEELVGKLSEFLSCVEEKHKEEAMFRVGMVVEDWHSKLGQSDHSYLKLALTLLTHLNRSVVGATVEDGNQLAMTVLPQLSAELGVHHALTLRAMLIQGEILARMREPGAFALLSDALAKIAEGSAKHNKTSSEVYGTLEGELHQVLGKVELGRSNLDGARAHTLSAVTTLREAPRSTEQRQLLVDAIITHAHLALENGFMDDDEGLDQLLQAKGLAKGIIDEDPECYFRASDDVAEQYRMCGDFKKCTAEAEGSLALAVERFPPTHPIVLTVKSNLANYLSQQDYVERALVLLEEVLPHCKDTRLEVNVLGWLAAIYGETGRHGDAEALLNRQVRLARIHCGEFSNEVVEALRSKAALLASARRMDEAVAVLNQALALNEDVETGIPYNVFDLRDLAAKIALEMGDMAEARGHAQAMLRLRLDAVGRNHPHVADVLFLQARIEVRSDPSTALELIRQALAIQTDYYDGKPHHATVEMLVAAAELLIEDEGQPEEALKLQKQAVEMNEQLLGEDAPDTIASSLRLAEIMLVSGKGAEGMKIVESIISRLQGAGQPLYLAMAYGALVDFAANDVERLATSKKALDELGKLGRPHALKVTVNHGISELYFERGDTVSALEHQRAACREAKDIYGEESLEFADEAESLARFLVVHGTPEEAIPLVDQANAIRRRLKSDEENIAEGLVLAGSALMTMQRPNEAGEKFKEAAELAEHFSDNALAGIMLTQYGEYLLEITNEIDKGAELLERALPMLIEGKNFEIIASIPVKLFDALPEEAMRWMPLFESAAEVLESAEGEADIEVIQAFNEALLKLRAKVQGRLTKAAT